MFHPDRRPRQTRSSKGKTK